MELTFRNSNIGCYQIVEVGDDGKRYLMDTSTVTPKSYYRGKVAETVTVEMIELAENNNQFSITSSVGMSTSVVAIIVQPFVKIGYDMLKRFFINYDVSQQVMLKLFLFVISMIIPYFIIWNSLRVAHQKAAERLPRNSRKYMMTFKTNGKRDLGAYIILLLNLICLLFFLYLNNGYEGALLVINGIITLPLYLYTWTMSPISSSYKNGALVVEKFEEIN
ncbi:hypothetical protein [Streptococcus loxodontisalivarius]|uniref:Membrane protein (TIGR01218 family) n=1 Tax=Streptococcus loxodontisalivarius TaxID=1349415 RepID=A0ABS2PRV7_9STRE|nr:hypothetical protein [Streptococcus loxodontisalivarius]MBM7642774.1 putative membrane protein (TIGR01218 family) [Streptococcus loxodontisalivarius]